MAFHSIPLVLGSWLEIYFQESEVYEVVRAPNDDKAPGSSGFSIAFSQT
jgi:hypothetical protein